MKDVTVFGGVRMTPEGVPHCERCNRQVDFFSIEKPVAENPNSTGYFREFRHTGEIILTIRCHGEEWRASNRRGKISPD